MKLPEISRRQAIVVCVLALVVLVAAGKLLGARQPAVQTRAARVKLVAAAGSSSSRLLVDVSGAVEFWDLTNRQDYHVVELQQQGTRSRSWEAGRYSNQEAAVHAFDLMCADRYASDGRRTAREARTEVPSTEKRVAARAAAAARDAGRNRGAAV